MWIQQFSVILFLLFLRVDHFKYSNLRVYDVLIDAPDRLSFIVVYSWNIEQIIGIL